MYENVKNGYQEFDHSGTLIVYALLAVFSYLFTVSLISTTVLNTFDTWTKNEREAQGRFEIASTITPWIVRYEVQLLINRIYWPLKISNLEIRKRANIRIISEQNSEF